MGAGVIGRSLSGEKATVEKSKEAIQKAKPKEDKKALKSKAKQQRRALMKKGIKHQVSFHISVFSFQFHSNPFSSFT